MDDTTRIEVVEKISTDLVALQLIHEAMDGVEWSPDTLDAIATVLTNAGYEIRSPHEEDERQKWYLGAALYFDVSTGPDGKPIVDKVTVMPHQEDFTLHEGQIGLFGSDEINEALFRYMEMHTALGRDEQLYELSWEG